MGDRTGIEWTDVTDNVIVAVDENGAHHGWWCRKISPGCTFCYAEVVNDSDYFHGNHLSYTGQPPVLKLREDLIAKWRRQTKPRKHFVMSMSDLFGEWVPRSWIFAVLDGALAAPLQTLQFLTKRADVMRTTVLAWLDARGLAELPPNIWLGIEVPGRVLTPLLKEEGLHWGPSDALLRQVFRSSDGEPEVVYRVGRKRAGRQLDGRTWSEFPEVRS